jgi:hypothetical protein
VSNADVVAGLSKISDSKSSVPVLALGAAFGAALSYLAYSSYSSKKKQSKAASLAWDPVSLLLRDVSLTALR